MSESRRSRRGELNSQIRKMREKRQGRSVCLTRKLKRRNSDCPQGTSLLTPSCLISSLTLNVEAKNRLGEKRKIGKKRYDSDSDPGKGGGWTYEWRYDTSDSDVKVPYLSWTFRIRSPSESYAFSFAVSGTC